MSRTPNFATANPAPRIDPAAVLGLLCALAASALGGPIFHPPVECAVGPEPVGLAFGDVDADGDLDVATAIPSTNCIALLTNNGSGVLGSLVWIPISRGAESVYLEDLNGDGLPDLIAPAGDARTVSVRWNNGDGTWGADLAHPLSLRSNSVSSIEFGDVEGDGDVDMIVIRNGSGSLGGTPGDETGVHVLHNIGYGWFDDAPGDLYFQDRNPADARFVDLDDNGVRELLIAFRSIGSVVAGGLELSQNLGAAGFDPVGVPVGPQASSTFVRVGDVDGDGMPDVCTANVLNKPGIIRNTGGLTFATVGPIPTIGVVRCVDLDLRDVDLDGDLDCVISDPSNSVSRPSRIATVLNDGTGRFLPARTTPVAPPLPGASVTDLDALEIDDLNGDGYPDVVVALPDNGTVCVLHNKGPQPAIDLCFADLNEDGRVDASDFVYFAARFGQTVYPYYLGDLSGDGVVNTTDFTILAADFGLVCP